MNDLSVPEIAAAMRGTDFPPRFDAAESRPLIKLLQLVSEGSPLPQNVVEQAASNLHVPSGSTASIEDGYELGRVAFEYVPNPFSTA